MVFVSFKKGFNKDISPATISSWIKQTVILCYELSDQEAYTLHQVKAHDVRAFDASKVFQSGVFLRYSLVSLPLKSHNTLTQFYLKGGAWADSELYLLGLVVAAQQIHKWPLDWGDFYICINSSSCTEELSVACFLREVYLHSGTELIPLFPYLRAGLEKKRGGGRRRYSPG